MSNEEPRYLGHYRLLECLAYGGMGEVWKALDTKLNRTVAVKLLRSELRRSSDFVARFESEAQLIASLHHPNIVKIHNFYVSQEAEAPLMYMVMDYVEGQTLADYIRKTSGQGQFPSPADIVYIFTVVSLALDYAHDHTMIHRDIKPANILLDQRRPNAHAMGEPILSDFGIARRQGVSGGTIIGSVVGTPLYVSPEQAQGNYDDKRSDLYSLGIILYEIMTGVTPFRNAAAMALVVQHIYEQPTPPELINPRISPQLSAVILKSIAKRPEDRFATASELSIALARALQVPIPEALAQHDIPTDALDSRSSLSYSPSTLGNSGPPGPSLPLHPTLPAGAYNSPASLSRASQSSQSGISFSTLPAHSASPLQNDASVTYTPTIVPSSQASALPSPSTPKTHTPFLKNRLLVITLSALLLIALGIGIATFALSSRQTSAEVVVGQLHFSSSGPSSKPFDTLQIDIQNVPPPPAGKVYVAWIDQVANESNHPHWQVQPDYNHAIHGTHLTYPSFNNLLLPNSLFIVTLQDAGSSPLVPSISPADRLYYARLDKQPSPVLDLHRCPTDPNSTTCI
ncbi:MAG: protein kinase [Ktedonobacteraceae bacterium]|nr:protein kinase [Ktedonobacteraceae bacterium]